MAESDPQITVRERLPGLRLPDVKDLGAWNDPHTRQSLLWEREAIRALLPGGTANREDFAWYRRAALEGFCFFYDSSTYDRHAGRYTLDRFLDDAEREFGGFDTIILWQPYPRIGIDQRNQFDFWRHMPGGLKGVTEAVSQAHDHGTRCLLNYLPWDGHTRRENRADVEVMAELLEVTGADGVFGDTMTGFPREFGDALDGLRPGLVLESEETATPAQATWQAGSWMKNYRPDPHLVPFVRWLQPEHGCFAVNRHQSDRGRLLGWSFLFGMGNVVWENVFGWWTPVHEPDRDLLRRLTPLLRQHADAFADPGWAPVPGMPTGLHANYWRAPGKVVITLLNATAEPMRDLPVTLDLAGFTCVTDALTGSRVRTRESGTGGLSELLVSVPPNAPGCLLLTHDEPAAPSIAPPPADGPTVRRRTSSRRDNLPLPPGKTLPRARGAASDEVVPVPAGRFLFAPYHPWVYDEGGCYDYPGDYGNRHDEREVHTTPLLVDRTEVTNEQYHRFLLSADYQPTELINFLSHWVKPSPDEPGSWLVPDGQNDHPVVWVDLDDARAYARWAGKRLPTEEEWHFAAQGSDGRTWPWGEGPPEGRCNTDSPSTVPVGAFPDAASPWGCLGMAGNVWEWTESERDDGHTRYAILKSGSHWRFPRDASPWYVASGAQPCAAHQKMLLMYPGLDRCATLGFRCVQDAE